MRDIDMTYYNIYYYCNIADNLITYFTESIDWASTAAQFTEPFFEEYPGNFPKYSVLHNFCEFVIRQILFEDAHEDIENIQEKYDELSDIVNKEERLKKAFNYDNRYFNRTMLEVDHVFRFFNIEHIKFFDYLLVSDFISIQDKYDDFLMFDGDFDDIILQLSREMFYVLFQNRDFLLRFNTYLSNSNNYDTKRVSIPSWVKRAVKYRDRGKCVICGTDLSGILDTEDKNGVHYDHIVPLHVGGLNDVSNIQLMCSSCNTRKSATSCTSTKYKDWYDFD